MNQIHFNDNVGTISFADNGEHINDVGSMPIIPLNGCITIKEIGGINSSPLTNESQRHTSKTYIGFRFINQRTGAYYSYFNTATTTKFTIKNCSILITPPALGVWKLMAFTYLSTTTRTPIKVAYSQPFFVVKPSDDIVHIRTTNTNDSRYRSHGYQEFYSHYAYLKNWREEVAEKVVKYDNEEGVIVPLVGKTYNTYNFSTYATAPHTLRALKYISNNDFIKIGIHKGNITNYYEVVKTTEEASVTYYERSNDGEFSCNFVGQYTGQFTDGATADNKAIRRWGIFVPKVDMVGFKGKTTTYAPISELCNHASHWEYAGNICTINWTNEDAKLDLQGIKEIPDDFCNFTPNYSRKITLFNSNQVVKVGENFGNAKNSFEVYFENVESIGKNFKANNLTGLVKLPKVVEKMNFTSTNSAKMFGSNITLKDSKLSLTSTTATFSLIENCTINTALTDNLTKKATLRNCKIAPTTTAMKIKGDVVLDNCQFVPNATLEKQNNPYQLDLSEFKGEIKNSFSMPNKKMVVINASNPTYKVDNDSFVGCNLMSNSTTYGNDYLKRKLDSIKRQNVSTAIYEGLALIGNYEGVNYNFFATEKNDRNSNQRLNTTDVFGKFILPTDYKCDDNFGQGWKFTDLNLATQKFTASNGFMNGISVSGAVTITAVQLYDILTTTNNSLNVSGSVTVTDEGFKDCDWYYLHSNDTNFHITGIVYCSAQLQQILQTKYPYNTYSQKNDD